MFGTNKNQNDIAPDVVLASAVIDIPGAFLRVARDVKAGTFKAAITKLGMAENVITFVVNPALSETIPPEAAKRLEETEKAIVARSIDVPSSEF